MASVPTTQRALAFGAYAEDPKLCQDVTTPALIEKSGNGTCLIRVHAASLNPIDKLRQQGQLKMLRPESKFPAVLGYDVAGAVVDKGSSEKFKVGDKVAARVVNAEGTIAEYAVVEDKTGVSISEPVGENWAIETAAIGLAGQTALQAFRRANVQKGEAVFITAGAGGVGTLAIQIAKQVIGAGFVGVTASGEEKIALCKELGADLVVDYKKDDLVATALGAFSEEGRKYNFALDCTGEAEKLFGIIKAGGQIRTIGGGAANLKPTAECFEEIGTPVGLVMRGALYAFSWLNNRQVLAAAAKAEAEWKWHFLAANCDDQRELVDAWKNGHLKIVLDSVHSLDDAEKAWERLVGGRSKGKVVVKMV